MSSSTDDIGLQILQSMETADAFNYWMYQTIKPYLNGDILEIGSGIGNISNFLLKENFNLTLSDVNKNYLGHLKAKFHHLPNEKFLFIDLSKADFSKFYADLKNKYDCIFLLNVLEHIKEDTKAVENCHFLLKQYGVMIVLVPAYQVLYSTLDLKLGHQKRYTLKTLKHNFPQTLFSIKSSFYFNSLGIAGWLYSKLFSLQTISDNNMKKYNKLVAVAKLLDRLFRNRIGLSAIIVASKK